MSNSKDNDTVFNLGNGNLCMRDVKLNKEQPLECKGLSECYSIGSDNKKWETVNF